MSEHEQSRFDFTGQSKKKDLHWVEFCAGPNSIPMAAFGEYESESEAHDAASRLIADAFEQGESEAFAMVQPTGGSIHFHTNSDGSPELTY